MPVLIAIAFAEETVAGQAAEELGRLAEDLQLDPDAIGVIICERDGSCRLAASHHPGATATWGRFWGVLFGVLMGEVHDLAIDPGLRRQIRRFLKPATSILLVAPERLRPERVAEVLSQYDGTLMTFSLGEEEMAELGRELERS